MSLFDLPPEVTDYQDSDEAIVIINVEGQVVLMTKAACEIAAVDAEDMIGEFVEMLVPSNRRWGHQAYRRGWFAEPAQREMDPGLEPELERPDGTLVPIHGDLEPIRAGGQLFGMIRITVRDT
jgi:PAS domain S-box-containing protein